MPLRTETYDFAAEIDRLESELQDIAETVAGLEDGNPHKREEMQRGQQLDVHLAGVRWALHTAHEDDAVPEWDEQVETVTLSGLTGGEMAMVEDQVAHVRQQHNDNSIGMGAVRIHSVAAGTRDAPYVDDGMSQQERRAAVSSLPNQYVRWAEHQIDGLSEAKGNGGKRFGDWLADSRDSET